ncbi:helix-turn-helix transcriptional regulator [soil metagenome]|jgi:molybdopterin-binding protein
MPHFRISEAASLLGVSDDTVRRWADLGRLPTVKAANGRLTVEGSALAEFAQQLAQHAAQQAAEPAEPEVVVGASARNRFRGIVTKVTRDTVMAQVEMQAGPFRVVSLMSREAADELGLDAGTLAVASVKSTHVVIELPES